MYLLNGRTGFRPRTYNATLSMVEWGSVRATYEIIGLDTEVSDVTHDDNMDILYRSIGLFWGLCVSIEG